MMALIGHPDPATTHQGVPVRRTVTGARRAALFASGLQRSDAPTTTMAAQAITATVRRFGIDGCVSRMAQEFGDHPDTAAERMRWICQLTALMPTFDLRVTAETVVGALASDDGRLQAPGTKESGR